MGFNWGGVAFEAGLDVALALGTLRLRAYLKVRGHMQVGYPEKAASSCNHSYPAAYEIARRV